MIVKFDHITYVAKREDREEELSAWQKKGWRIKFSEEDLINVPAKKTLMKNRGKTHDLYFLEKENEMNTELIFYDRASKGPALEIKENYIYAKSKDLGKTKLIVKEVGGKVSEISDRSKRLICNMKGVLDKEDFWLVVEKAVELDDIYLDTWGGGV